MKKSIIILSFSLMLVAGGYAQKTALFAGAPNTTGSDPTTPAPDTVNAKFNLPYSLAYDSKGYLYIVEFNNHRIRMVYSDGKVYTIAGYSAGFKNASGIAAQFDFPCGIAINQNTDTIYVVDQGNKCIRKIAAFSSLSNAQAVTTFATGFTTPTGIGIDDGGSVYVSDFATHVIKKITPAGVVSIFAGALGIAGDADGAVTSARFNQPSGIYVTSGGVYVCDKGNQKIKKISGGQVTTVVSGLFNPDGVFVSDSGNIYIMDNWHIWKYTVSTSKLTNFVGSTTTNDKGYVEGVGGAAKFNLPQSMVFNAANNKFYVTDTYNQIIRTIYIGVKAILPVPNFTTSANTITQGKSVTFTDQSTNNPTGWTWQVNPPAGANPSYTTLQNPVITFTALGTFRVCLSASNTAGASDTFCKSIIVDKATGISQNLVSSFNIYPSPTSDKLNIESGNTGFKSVTISDIAGKIVYHFNSTDNSLLNRLTIDVSSFNPGLYMVNISDGTDNMMSKFVKK